MSRSDAAGLAMSLGVLSACSFNHANPPSAMEDVIFPCPPSGLTEHGIQLGEWRQIRLRGAFHETQPALDAYNAAFLHSLEILAERHTDPDALIFEIEAAEFACTSQHNDETGELQISCEANCAIDMPMAQLDHWIWDIELSRSAERTQTHVVRAEMNLEIILY